MFTGIAQERRSNIDMDRPSDLVDSIESAIGELKFYSALQEHTYQAIEPIEELCAEIADACSRLVELGEEIPVLDLVDIDPQFVDCMKVHPILAPLAEKFDSMQRQAELKAKLLQKWGPRRGSEDLEDRSLPTVLRD